MGNGSWLLNVWKWLKIKWGTIAESVLFWRRTRDNFSDDYGRCLTCNGTGKWYEGTVREEPCVNCDGTGWRPSVNCASKPARQQGEIVKESKKLCHLFSKRQIVFEDLKCLEVVEVLFDDGNHYERSVKKCKKCGAWFLYEFTEFVNYSGGDDAIYCTYVQTDSREDALRINNSGQDIQSFYPAIYHGDSENIFTALSKYDYDGDED